MDDIAKLATRLMLISSGQIVYDGTIKHFMESTEQIQTLTIQLSEPLTSTIVIDESNSVGIGQQAFSLKLKSGEIPRAISQIAQKGNLVELKIQEVNFEDIIREFMQKEYRSGEIRHT